jgi:hypothetical protein
MAKSKWTPIKISTNVDKILNRHKIIICEQPDPTYKSIWLKRKNVPVLCACYHLNEINNNLALLKHIKKSLLELMDEENFIPNHYNKTADSLKVICVAINMIKAESPNEYTKTINAQN